jgi:hypothetical protein
MTEPKTGAISTKQVLPSGTINWNHFHYNIPKVYQDVNMNETRGNIRVSKELLQRVYHDVTFVHITST